MTTPNSATTEAPIYALRASPPQIVGRARSILLPTVLRILYAALALITLAGVARCQESPRVEPAGAIPNIKAEAGNGAEHESLHSYNPLTSREKFQVASEDSLDPGAFALAAGFGGLGQLTNAERSFGQGAAGFGRYFGAAYGDLLIGNYMSEAVYASILHQDPRYFRRGAGSGRSRFSYAISRIFLTHRDSGGTQFNYSEWLGKSTAAAISTAYYPGQRSAGGGLSQLAMQIGVDAAGNVWKEFWPDLRLKFSRRAKSERSGGGTR